MIEADKPISEYSNIPAGFSLAGARELNKRDMVYLAAQVKQLLTISPFLVNWDLTKLIEFVETGQSVQIVKQGTLELAAFAKLEEHRGTDLAGNKLVELGSIVVAQACRGKNLGMTALLRGINLAQERYLAQVPSRLVSVIATNNQRSLALFDSLPGRVWLEEKPSNLQFHSAGEKAICELTYVSI